MLIKEDLQSLSRKGKFIVVSCFTIHSIQVSAVEEMSVPFYRATICLLLLVIILERDD